MVYQDDSTVQGFNVVCRSITVTTSTTYTQAGTIPCNTGSVNVVAVFTWVLTPVSARARA